MAETKVEFVFQKIRSRLSAHTLLLIISVTAISLQIVFAPPGLAKHEVATEENLTLDKPTYDLWQKGLSYMKEQHFEQAAEIFRKTVELLPDKASPHCNLMNCLIKLGDVEGAVNEAEAAEKIAPDTPVYLFNLANAYQIAGRLDDAIHTYTRCLHRFPDDERCKRTKAVIKELKRAAAQRQDSPAKIGLAKNAFSKWRRNRMPLRVYIEPGDPVKNFNPSFDQILISAFQAWSAASEGRVSFRYVDSKDQSDIVVVWEAERTKVTAAEDGNTHLEYDARGMNIAARIILLTTTITGEPMGANQMKEVSLHEIGHALGITQHSRNPEDIMFYSMHGRVSMTALSEHDKQTIKQLYDFPDAAPPPAAKGTQFEFQLIH